MYIRIEDRRRGFDAAEADIVSERFRGGPGRPELRSGDRRRSGGRLSMACEMDELRELFIAETEECFVDIDQSLVRLESHPHDRAALETIYRRIHTFKGSCNLFRIVNAREFAHRYEDLMDVLSRDPSLVDERTVFLLFEGFDVIKKMFRAIRDGVGDPEAGPDGAAFLDRMRATIDGRGNASTDVRVLLGWLEAEILSGGDGRRAVDLIGRIRASLDGKFAKPPTASSARGDGEPLTTNGSDVTDLARPVRDFLSAATTRMPENDAVERFFADFAALIDRSDELTGGACSDLRTAFAESAEVFAENELEFDEMMTEHYARLFDEIVKRAAIVAEQDPRVADQPPAGDDAVAPARGRSIRVDEARIDRSLALVGDMIVTGEVFNYLERRIADRLGRDPVLREYRAANLEFGDRVFELQKLLMEVRRVTIDAMFGKLPRLVRDVARNAGRDIRLELEGGDAVVDKSRFDAIEQALHHVIRNAVDHGVEPADERIRNGKPAQGRVRVAAVNDGEMLRIRVSDDGRGVDLDRLREAAVAKGLVESAEKAAALDRAETLELMFKSGVSTARNVSTTSGRGVGLDAALTGIRGCGGKIGVTTEAGRGTEFEFALPIAATVGVLTGMLAIVGQTKFVIPIEHMVESFRPANGQVSTVMGGGEVATVAGRVMPLFRMSGIFGIGAAAERPADGVVLIVTDGAGGICLFADDIREQVRVVVKKIAGLEDLAKIQGAAVLGDGGIGLVLDVPALAAALREKSAVLRT